MSSSTLLRGALPVLLLGGVYALLMTRLAQGGHVPSATHGLLVAPARYYAVAALYVAPLCLLLWVTLGGVTCAVARRAGGRATMVQTLTALGPAYAWPLTFLFAVPDLVVLECWGHGALAGAMPWYAPLAVLWVWVACSRATSRAHAVSAGWGWAAATLGLLAQAIPAGLLLR